MKFFSKVAKKQEDKNSDFIQAIKDQDIDKARYELEIGADVNTHNSAAIKWALYRSDLELCKLLVENKTEIKFENAFVYPVIRNNSDLFDLVEATGLKPNEYNDEPLIRAILTNNAKMIGKIVSSYPDIENGSAEELLKFCAKDDKSYYAFIHILDNIENITFDLFDEVHKIAGNKGSNWALERLDSIKRANEEANADRMAEQVAQHKRILIEIAIAGDVESMQEYIKRDFDIHHEDDIALRYTAYYNHPELFDILVNAGADINADDNGALRWAIMQDNKDIIIKLLDLGVSPEAGLKIAEDRNKTELSEFFKDKIPNIEPKTSPKPVLKNSR